MNLILNSKKAFLLLCTLIIYFAPNNGQSQSKTVQYQDTHREIPGFIDFGLYQTYKITPEEISAMKSKQMREMIEMYIRRYYDFYMYFSRDIIVKQVYENYPADLLDPVIKTTLSASDEDLRKLLLDFFHNESGVTRVNKTINDLLVPVMRDWEMKKFGSLKTLKGPPFHSPNAIYLAYLKKMGLRAYDYTPPFYPKGMDPDEQKKITILGKQTNLSISENGMRGQIIAFLIGLILGALSIKLLSPKK